MGPVVGEDGVARCPWGGGAPRKIWPDTPAFIAKSAKATETQAIVHRIVRDIGHSFL